MCERIRLPNGAAAIVCGVKHKRQRCAFCGSPAGKLCDWKTEKPIDIPHGQLQMGDVIETRQHKHHLPVRSIQRFRHWITVGSDQFNLVVTMYGLVFPDGRCWLYYPCGPDKVRVLRPGTCDKPCCEMCSREAGENLDYCKDHWQAWQFDTALDQRSEILGGGQG